MEDQYKILIDKTEFQQKILDCISSEELDKMINNTTFKDNPEYKIAIIQGMTFASMLTSQCKSFYIKENEEDKVEDIKVGDIISV